MAQNYKISVIVPVYNVEKYIEKCLNSLFEQTYPNLEIIIVDDASKDHSKEIIKKLIEGKSNAFLIENKENKGLSYTRNVALQKATGDYIGYIDSDDYVEPNYYESLMNSRNEIDADIVVCDMNIIYEDNPSQNVRRACGEKNDDKLAFINNGLAASACNKLFKRSLIEMYPFAEGKINEDLAVILPLITQADHIAYNCEVCYNYIQRQNSIQNSNITDKRLDIFEAVDLTLKRMENVPDYEKYKEAIVYQQLIMVLIYLPPKEKKLVKRAKFLKKLNRLIKKYDIFKNVYLKEFLNGQGRIRRIYYKLFLQLNSKGFSLLSSSLISFYDLLRNKLVKDVIPESIQLKDVIDVAKKQQKMSDEKIRISVVVPNYNYAKYIYERLYSILYQKVKIYELIILDDCSTDNSINIIDTIKKQLQPYVNIKTIYNDTNSGSPFKQWQKGFEVASGDYVWIAEADDYCDCEFLKNVIAPIQKNDHIVISYTDTAFINGVGEIITKSIKSEIDVMKTGHWNHNYVNIGTEEIKQYAFLNNTIANVSSTLIKKDNYSHYFEEAGKYRQAGDWLLYVNVMQHGKVAYINKPLNYYRLHGNNVSSVTKKEAHIEEIKNIHTYYRNLFPFTKWHEEQVAKRYEFLEKVWELNER